MVVFSRLTFQVSGIAIAAIVVASMSVHNNQVASNVAPVGELVKIQTASAVAPVGELVKITRVSAVAPVGELVKITRVSAVAPVGELFHVQTASAALHKYGSNSILAVSRTPVDSSAHSLRVTNIDFTPKVIHYY